jgi:glycosyltransferase involved in cell wall biosynthesis
VKISVVVSQFLDINHEKQGKMQSWVDDINCVLKEKNRIKVFVSVEDKRFFSLKNTREINYNAYSTIETFEDPVSPKMYLSFIRDKPDLVIIHALPHFTTAMATVIFGLKKIPIILLVHGVYSCDGFVNKVRNFAVKLFVAKYVNNIIALTHYDANLLRNGSWKFDARKITHIPLGLSLESQTAIKRFKELIFQKKNSSEFTYLFVGRLIKEKRVGMLIDAFYELLKKTRTPQPVKLHIVGDGPELKSLQLKVHDYQIDGFVNFLGWVGHTEIWKEYLGANVIVIPSEIEGFPYVIFEAFACGKPVISSNICGLSEIVQHDKNGLLFSSKEELTSCLMCVLTDSKLLDLMSENAVETAKEFNVVKTVRKIAKVTNLDLI